MTQGPSDEPYDRYRAVATFGSLDGLRALSILPVVWHHSTPRPLEGVLGKGPLGVDLFFTISGFLITTLLLRERDRSGRGRVSEASFYKRRALRIFPLYYTILGLYVLRAFVFPPAPDMRAHFFASLPFFATFTTNWFVDFAVSHPVVFAFSWSLATEEQFYALWPWLFRLRWAPLVVAVALLVIDQAAERGMLSAVLPPASLGLRMATSIATPICMGAIAGCLLHVRSVFNALRIVLAARWSAPVVFAALVYAIAIPGVTLVWTHVILTLLVTTTAIREDHGLASLLRLRPLVSIGTVSYGMYMVHVALVTGVKNTFPLAYRSTVPVFVVSLALSYLVARASYRFLETPFLRLRKAVGR